MKAITTWYTDAEFAKVRKEAKAAGETVEEFAKRRTIGGSAAVKPAKAPAKSEV